jgi:hypothetical protein
VRLRDLEGEHIVVLVASADEDLEPLDDERAIRPSLAAQKPPP